MTFAMTAGGTTVGKLLIEALGIGLGSGMTANPSWGEAFESSRGVGALILTAFEPLGTFGHFCTVLLALSIIANMVPGTYSLGLNFQMFGSGFAKIPRAIWSTFGVLISMVCAIAGREKLLTIFLNFLALIGYWVIIWVTMTLQEELIFRRKKGYDWTLWNQQKLLPVGYAAFVTFLIGWAGAIVSMSQTYYTGPIGAMVGHGADVSFPSLILQASAIRNDISSVFESVLTDFSFTAWSPGCNVMDCHFLSTTKVSGIEVRWSLDKLSLSKIGDDFSSDIQTLVLI